MSSRFASPALTAGARLAASAAKAEGHRERERSAPAPSSGVSPQGMTARTRASPVQKVLAVAPRCHRAEWTFRVVSVRRSQDSHASHARLAFEHPCTGRCPLLPGVIPRSPAGVGACSQFGSHEATKMSDAPQALAIIARPRLAAAKNLGTASPMASHLRGFV